MKYLTGLTVILLLVQNVIEVACEFGHRYFSDVPQMDYHDRDTLFDCPLRFYNSYTNSGKQHTYGGERAYRGEFAHMASIGWTTANKTRFLCGGALITTKFVLTAAHCATDGNGKRPDTVRLGDTNLETTEDDEFAQQIGIKSIKKHPEHRGSRKYYDLALIELETDAVFNEAICKACLWVDPSLPTEPMDAVGFGAASFGGDLSPTLQKVLLSVINRTECTGRLSINRRSLPQGLIDDQFCAGSETMDTCEGDSGGPIEVKRVDVDSRVISLVVGVVSFGAPCSEGSSGVYTKISPYIDWVESVVGQIMDPLVCARTTYCQTMKHVSTPFLDEMPTRNRVGLVWNGSDNTRDKCGGTLIDYNYVLTSAFCARNKHGFPTHIDLLFTDEVVPIEKVVIHPRYNQEKPENDIALLKLSQYLIGDSDLLPACLWPEEKITNDYERLHYAAVTTQSSYSVQNYRDDKYSTIWISTKLADNGKCVTEGPGSNKLICGNNTITNLLPSACKVDYGGPVSFSSFEHFPYLYGVVSTMSKGCESDLVGTRIFPHIKWIESIILENTNERLVFTP